ncbi:MAG: GspH/FimT family pseudopilin [Burkholderiales bacterium]|jgi:type IV fimbrial biogenesis protein FimT|nr:GspH/FimT family pseudopilin [Burkholderiales bacterium]
MAFYRHNINNTFFGIFLTPYSIHPPLPWFGAPPPTISRGVTALEILITLSIFAILTVVGVPSVMSIVERQQTYNLAHALKDTMARARIEAMKRNQRVTVCPTLDGTTCLGEQWEKGWIMFEDNNSNALREENEELIDVQIHNFSAATAKGNTPVKKYVSFLGDGRPQTITGALQMGTFTVCGKEEDAIHVVFSISGNARVERVALGCAGFAQK